MEKKEVRHCGLCEEFPCDLFMDSYDPSKGLVSSVARAGIWLIELSMVMRKRFNLPER